MKTPCNSPLWSCCLFTGSYPHSWPCSCCSPPFLFASFYGYFGSDSFLLHPVHLPTPPSWVCLTTVLLPASSHPSPYFCSCSPMFVSKEAVQLIACADWILLHITRSLPFFFPFFLLKSTYLLLLAMLIYHSHFFLRFRTFCHFSPSPSHHELPVCLSMLHLCNTLHVPTTVPHKLCQTAWCVPCYWTVEICSPCSPLFHVRTPFLPLSFV